MVLGAPARLLFHQPLILACPKRLQWLSQASAFQLAGVELWPREGRGGSGSARHQIQSFRFLKNASPMTCPGSCPAGSKEMSRAWTPDSVCQRCRHLPPPVNLASAIPLQSLGLGGTFAALARRDQGDPQVLMFPAQAHHRLAQRGALGMLQPTTSLERHDSRGQAVAASSGHQSVCGGSGSQPGHHMGPLPSLSGLHLSCFSLRAKTRCFSSELCRLAEDPSWQREMEVASLLFGTQAGHRPSEGMAALGAQGRSSLWLPPPAASQLPCLSAWPEMGGKGGQQLQRRSTCMRKCGAGDGRLWGRGQSGHPFPWRREVAGRQAGLQFCIRKTNRLQQKGIQQAEGQTHTLLCTNCQTSGHLQRMRALPVPALPPAPTRAPC